MGKTVSKIPVLREVSDVLGISEQEQKLGKGFAMTAGGIENQAMQGLSDRMAGRGTSLAQLQYAKALDDAIKGRQSAAASARGVSNPALLQRNVAQATQEMDMERAREAGMLKAQEQMQAEQLASQIAAGQRGVNLEASKSDAQLAEAAQKRRSDFFANLASSGSKMATGGAKPTVYMGGKIERKYSEGGVVDGDVIVDADHPVNDTVDISVSGGEIVIPRSAAKSRDSAIAFLKTLEFENQKLKKESGEPDYKGLEDVFKELSNLKKKVAQLEK